LLVKWLLTAAAVVVVVVVVVVVDMITNPESLRVPQRANWFGSLRLVACPSLCISSISN
jgi:hypothetical protein